MTQDEVNKRLVEIRKSKDEARKRMESIQQQMTNTQRQLDVICGQEMEICTWITKFKNERATSADGRPEALPISSPGTLQGAV